MFQVPLATSASVLSRDEFWKSLLIYHNRPHIINRKIAVADQILFHKIDFNCQNTFNITDVLTPHALKYEVQRLEKVDRENIGQNFLLNLLDTYDKNVKLYEENIDTLYTSNSGLYISVRIILPRINKCSKCVELIVLDRDNNWATFFSACVEEEKLNPLPLFPYRIELTRENFMRIVLNNFEDADTSCAEWMFNFLFKKLINWTELAEEENVIQSLMRIPKEKYCHCYNNLKQIYGESLRKVWWEKTKTDPQKFIYEDIAIASYLICLWLEEYKGEARNFVNFVDCGCGNGLLVYILNKEGFKGHGIDLRKRRVWDLFSDSADLKVGIVDSNSKFPNATWLIGNHSDELTPWLPVIASKSSPITNYFVLPCCPFDFCGKRYIRKNSNISQYADYLQYINSISEICKFTTWFDKLRIPSTKRICLVGLRKNDGSEITSDIFENIDSLLKSKFASSNINFEARPSIEKVRNCTQIDQNVKQKIIEEICNCLLLRERFIIRDNGTKWNIGGSIPLSELSKLLTRDYMNHLKNEFGGLQTLLRNHRYIFKLEEAAVSLREPYTLVDTSKYKQKPCWYYKFHPDGCLYSDEICGYSHVE
ncbi:probable tRNA (uracil-O(2)-)-methyltransferase isoform X1 [Coccinella septempunctata]|uniref:probable tRNA (uracil-O(2)-)-methyltransferase isoform X1 n=1 Tax=Coccinella septempunctata TaxID=41139 RepID=UPI001D0803F3|nr:probable tRNA (uracil-O(2)-)-methyltransferase isoform X1 [Coccinella septempunctata]